MLGIFDSGLGGLTVAKEVLKTSPNQKIIYFGDTARVPYGNKSERIVTEYAFSNTEFLISKGAKIIIVACNTVSALSLDKLKNNFNLPIFGVIEPAISEAVIKTKNNKIGVIGTKATIKSGIYQKKVKENNSKMKVFSVATPLLVHLVEENWADKEETEEIIKRYLKPLKKDGIDTLILGCTHYPFLKELISDIMGPDITLIDSGEETAKEFKKLAKEMNFLPQENVFNNFYVSDLGQDFKDLAQKFLGEKIDILEVSPEEK